MLMPADLRAVCNVRGRGWGADHHQLNRRAAPLSFEVYAAFASVYRVHSLRASPLEAATSVAWRRRTVGQLRRCAAARPE